MGFWRKCRITFRWFRFTVWLLALVLIGAFFWLNRVGLPDFLKTRLVDAMRQQGVDLEFSRMRLSFVRGLVADDVRAGEPGPERGASFAARFVQLELDYDALWHRRLALDGLVLRDGTFTLPLSPTNALSLTNLQTALRFGTNDTWTIDQLRGDFAGVRININGEMTHAREVLKWPFFAGGTGSYRGAAVASLKDFSDVVRLIQFQGEPQVRLKISGDGHDIHSIVVRLDAVADGVRTPWFDAKVFQAAAALTAPAGAPTNNSATIGFWKNLQPFRLAWSARLGKLRSEKLDADAVVCAGAWAAPSLGVTNLSAQLGRGSLDAEALLNVVSRKLEFKVNAGFDPHAIGKLFAAETRTKLAKISWAQPPRLKAAGSLRLPPWTNTAAVDWHFDIEPSVQIAGELACTNVSVAALTVDSVRTHFRYDDLILGLPDLAIKQGKTELLLSGEESEATKNFRFALSGGIDAASVRPLLTDSNAVSGFELLSAPEPLVLALLTEGNLRSLETLAVTGRVALANFTVRGQTIESVAGQLAYTNKVLRFFHPELRRELGTQRMTADEIVLKLKEPGIGFTNGFSTADPMFLAQAIGPKTAQMLEPYHFLKPPTARVNGCLPLRNFVEPQDTVGTDMRFDVVEGVPFQWLNLNSTNMTGTIHWMGPVLILTNMQMEFYGGTGEAEAYFDFTPPHVGADYHFTVSVTNVNLHQFATQVASPTNRLEGTVAGRLAVTWADTRYLESWIGSGSIKLRDGLLWDVPIFAFMSPVLNAVSPGLGNSRATEASAQFIITNGVIATDSLSIQAQTMRLEYAGTVGFNGNVNAHVTARPLRNMPVVGSVFSTVLWPVSKIFECRVRGQLSNPVVTPLFIPGFIPKILSVPLHPIRSLGELFPTQPPNTNPPPTDK
jgi:hypothetical protein